MNEIKDIPHQALEAEMAVLGAMLIERDAVEKAVDALQEKDFYLEAHRRIFRALGDLYKRGDAVDLVTAGEELRKLKQLDDVGGVAALTELVSRVATAAHVDYYARLVKEKSILREKVRIDY